MLAMRSSSKRRRASRRCRRKLHPRLSSCTRALHKCFSNDISFPVFFSFYFFDQFSPGLCDISNAYIGIHWHKYWKHDASYFLSPLILSFTRSNTFQLLESHFSELYAQCAPLVLPLVYPTYEMHLPKYFEIRISHMKSISTVFCPRNIVSIAANNRAVFCKKIET